MHAGAPRHPVDDLDRAVSVEHVEAALGQNGPRVTRRAYLAPGAEPPREKVEQLIAGAS